MAITSYGKSNTFFQLSIQIVYEYFPSPIYKIFLHYKLKKPYLFVKYLRRKVNLINPGNSPYTT